MFEDISDETVGGLSEKCFESVAEKCLVDAVSDDEGLGGASTFESGVYGAFVISNENVLLHQALLSLIPVEISRNHVISLSAFFLFVASSLLFLSLDACEEGEGILSLDLSVSFGFLFGCFLFLVASGELSFLSCVFLCLLYDLALVEAQIFVQFTVSISIFSPH